MLKSIACEKLIQSSIYFKSGLNSVIGADDAHNSIGKSSVLMLIDFAFGGSDFPVKCDDVIKNVGHLEVRMEFFFGGSFSFVRNTQTPDSVYFVEESRLLTLREFTAFLKDNYLSANSEISFRDCVSGFLRVYQRNNYNPKRPLDSTVREKWEVVRKRLLKMFNLYWVISQLEQERTVAQKTLKDINGTFNSGAVKKITKVQVSKNNTFLRTLYAEIELIKESLKRNVTDIRSIINEKSLDLKQEKDALVEHKLNIKVKLSRVESNLGNSKVRNSKDFQAVLTLFPEVDSKKLLEVESFHSGITAILKEQLKAEQAVLLEALEAAELDIAKVDSVLLSLVDSREDSVFLLERLIELDRQQNDLLQQNRYWALSAEAKKEIADLKASIDLALESSVSSIENNLNAGVNTEITKIYSDEAISPILTLGPKDYRFEHGDDRGTGKAFANMIALDLTFLRLTVLPILIHDSLLFKNMDTPAIEHLVEIYSSYAKQIFISIDEVKKYKHSVQSLIEESAFLKLDKDRMAFKVKWKNAK
ncbi:DUF2326 domain-containing protein [Pseudomonas fluorescens]|uniref:DUF2326 domain-containing protein n=1 Tax=Pseudomonas fluorescens TaxID=294 RepID=UPI001BD97A3C|nr:DUF2326 domain-containing protein [Pseudomonas fluorescens]MBT0622729.1 DUF2326 domain-containing protein [Pseudomonas fluorescens]